LFLNPHFKVCFREANLAELSWSQCLMQGTRQRAHHKNVLPKHPYSSHQAVSHILSSPFKTMSFLKAEAMVSTSTWMPVSSQCRQVHNWVCGSRTWSYGSDWTLAQDSEASTLVPKPFLLTAHWGQIDIIAVSLLSLSKGFMWWPVLPGIWEADMSTGSNAGGCHNHQTRKRERMELSISI
jgi:hypothetical protein